MKPRIVSTAVKKSRVTSIFDFTCIPDIKRVKFGRGISRHMQATEKPLIKRSDASL